MNGFYVWDLQDDIERYNAYTKKCMEITPFHLTEYLLAEAQAEEGVIKIFLYEEDGMFALIPEVVRKINVSQYLHDFEGDLYDMITPHEYGGIVSNIDGSVLKNKLLSYISNYCAKNNIIFQFIRINPYLKELPVIYKKNGYELIHSDEQVYVDLTQTEDQIKKEYKANVRYGIRRAEREKLEFDLVEKSLENIRIFQKGYQKAMDILKARKFLYFNEKYFDKIINCDCSRLAMIRDKDGTTVAASILLTDKTTVYYHLSWLNRDYAFKQPMDYLLHSMIMWAKKNGYKTMHIAGGGESLKKFKGGFSNTRIDYYIAYQICEREKYELLCSEWRKSFPQYARINYYPLYRYNE